MEKPDSLITETLLQTRRQSDAVTAISDSALKVVLSYYPVCRCQRTSPELLRGKHSRPFQITKKLNLAPDRPSFAKATAGKRDKIESNLQSQMYVERTPCLEESRFKR